MAPERRLQVEQKGQSERRQQRLQRVQVHPAAAATLLRLLTCISDLQDGYAGPEDAWRAQPHAQRPHARLQARGSRPPA